MCMISMVSVFARGATDEQQSDEWYQLTLASQPCGWMHQWTNATNDLLHTGFEMELRVARAGQTVTVHSKQESSETATGEIRSASLETEFGGAPTKTTWEFAEGRVLERIDTGRKKSQREVARPEGDWLAPVAAQRASAAARARGESPFVIRTLDFEAGLRVATMTSTRAVELDSKNAPASTLLWWDTKLDIAPFPIRERYDASGVLVELINKTEMGDIAMVRSTREKVLGATGAAPELLARSLAPIQGVADAAALSRAQEAEYLVSRPSGAPLAIPSIGAQTAQRDEAGPWRVTVRVGTTSVASEAERADVLFTASSVLIDSDDERVSSLAVRALADEPPAIAHRAEILRRMVYKAIRRKDLGSAFASASEALATRSGDCTEHAALLAALLRSQGIPARVATGVVSADRFAGSTNVFAWHMWTQAIIDGQWVDLDATLPGRAFHPGHLLLGTSSQSGGVMDPALIEVAGLIGGVSFEVVRVR